LRQHAPYQSTRRHFEAPPVSSRIERHMLFPR
jgi:hypothetical protein